MPSAEQILEGLANTAHTWIGVAVAFHIALALLVYPFIAKAWRPAARTVAGALLLPVATVAVFAWLSRNPATGSAFTVLVLWLAAISPNIGVRPVRLSTDWNVWTGVAMIGFGWTYPHFLEPRSPWVYLIAAPFGVVPCPTLSVVIGVSLCFGSFGSRAWGAILGIAGLAYGLFGVFRLQVWLDVPLIAGALVILAANARRSYGGAMIR